MSEETHETTEATKPAGKARTRRRLSSAEEDVSPMHHTRKRAAEAASKKGMQLYRKYYYVERNKIIFVQEKYRRDDNAPDKGRSMMRRYRTLIGKANTDHGRQLLDELEAKGLLRRTEDVQRELQKRKRENAEAEIAAMSDELEPEVE